MVSQVVYMQADDTDFIISTNVLKFLDYCPMLLMISMKCYVISNGAIAINIYFSTKQYLSKI